MPSIVNEARSDVLTLLNRIETIVDDLVGAVPPLAVSDGIRDIHTSGILNEIAGSADEIMAATKRAHVALDRITNAIR